MFRTTFTASIAARRTGLCATETAIILAGQQWIAAEQHYLQLTRGLAGALPADACWLTVLVRSTRMALGGETVSVSQEGCSERCDLLLCPGLETYETGVCP